MAIIRWWHGVRIMLGLSVRAQRKISGDKLFLLLLHHGTV